MEILCGNGVFSGPNVTKCIPVNIYFSNWSHGTAKLGNSNSLSSFAAFYSDNAVNRQHITCNIKSITKNNSVQLSIMCALPQQKKWCCFSNREQSWQMRLFYSTHSWIFVEPHYSLSWLSEMCIWNKGLYAVDFQYILVCQFLWQGVLATYNSFVEVDNVVRISVICDNILYIIIQT